jgi:F-type H+-transporting ATPase subunit a
MNISPDTVIYWQRGPITINATLVFTWLVMALLVFMSWLATRKLTVGAELSRWQNAMEAIVDTIRRQIRDVTHQDPTKYVAFLGTLFLFISLSNLLAVVPRFHPPTGSLSTTAALAICVFFAVPIYGIRQQGVLKYLKQYLKPSPFMLPFNVIGELSRTLALAVRLFGNIMSGTLIGAILISVVPLFFPVVMNLLGLLVGQIQAYIFAILATVYIASSTRVQQPEQ